MLERLRPVLCVLLVAYLAAVAYVVFQPTPQVANRAIDELGALLRDLGAPAKISTPERVEFMLNAIMFVPITLLAYLGLGMRHWANVVVYAFVGSVAIELLQGQLLPDRTAVFRDIVSNTAGGLLGAVVGVVVRWALTGTTARPPRG